MITKINAWFVEHHSLTLVLMWIFTAIAVGIGAWLALMHPEMDYFIFLAYIAVPALLAIYLRLMYGRFEQQRRNSRNQKAMKKR